MSHAAALQRVAGDGRVLLLAPVLLFLPTWLGFLSVWEAQPYTHGYLVAAAAIWLLWRQRTGARPGREARASWLVVALLSLVWCSATVMDAQVVAQLTLPPLLIAWVASLYGVGRARELAPIAVFFLLAVPVWDVLTRSLQLATIAVTHAVVAVLGVPAVLEGDVVYLTYGSFVIEAGCAGLNYLLSGLTVGALYAMTFARGRRDGLVVLALAAVLPIVGNWIRVASLVVIGHATEMQSVWVTNSDLHFAYGWGIFVLTLMAFFPLASRAVGSKVPAATAAPDLPNTAATVTSGPQPPSLRQATVGTLALSVGPLLYYGISAVPGRAVPPPSLLAENAQWEIVPAELAPPFVWEPAFQGATERSRTTWVRGDDIVLVDRIVYHDQAQGSEMIGYTSRIAPDTLLIARRLLGPVGAARQLVNEAIIVEGDTHLLSWYWYRVGGAQTESPARAKLLELWAFATRRPVSEVIALTTPCRVETCRRASQVLHGFLGTPGLVAESESDGP